MSNFLGSLPLGAAVAGTSADGAESRVLRHVVLFAWKAGTPAETIRRIENAFRSLPGKIDAIADFEWGTDVSVENKAHGYTHAFLLTFRSEQDRAVYLPHTDHKAFGALLRPHVAKVLVVDYWQSR